MTATLSNRRLSPRAKASLGFLARYASMNSFTQLVISSQTRGLVKTWPPRIGSRSVL